MVVGEDLKHEKNSLKILYGKFAIVRLDNSVSGYQTLTNVHFLSLYAASNVQYMSNQHRQTYKQDVQRRTNYSD